MYLWIVGALLVLGGLMYSYVAEHPQGVIDGEHEGDVRSTVAAFGNQLNSVSLLSPSAADEMRNAYSPYVTEELLAAWIQNPEEAPGRKTSSPWPDHITVDAVLPNDMGAYTVVGRIMLKDSSGDAGTIPVSLTVTNAEGGYRITQYEENPGDTSLSEPVVLTAALGETVRALGVSLTPKEIEEDSRCPSDVACIQAGTVRVLVETVDGMGTSTARITLGDQSPITTEVVSIWLTKVSPQRVTTNPTEDEAYRFTFRVEAR